MSPNVSPHFFDLEPRHPFFRPLSPLLDVRDGLPAPHHRLATPVASFQVLTVLFCPRNE
ncbi:hypothetical protein M407DRAFT_245240 [Tulasnella calospora MUT 4182]|uniref:Uncharacterized protein n=1 Tax=Tulasnella calospora MUT 4182 TaxID=1051891 RepID=A0A0C3QAZ5_9AGAM|nr:hypothetical protein M407DRAFT_245240 [Tulasnella calospora MUT 4182]